MTLTKPPVVESGEWKNRPGLVDYRSEWLTDVLVERVAWASGAAAQYLPEMIADIQIAGPGYVWLRFWLREEEQIVEKYFDSRGGVVGFFAPICMPFREVDKVLSAQTLGLALWYDADGRLTILGEDDFDRAAREQILAPVEVEHAEHRTRELTLSVLNKTFPPGLARNFTIATE